MSGSTLIMRHSGPIPVDGNLAAFPRGGVAPRDRLKRLVDEYGHGSATRLPQHRNPGLEIVYLRHGHLNWEYEGRRESLPPDSVFFTLPWETHGSSSEFEPGHEWYFAVLRLKGRNLGHPGTFSFPRQLELSAPDSRSIISLLRKAPRRVWPATPVIRSIFPALIGELDGAGPFHERYVTQLLALLVVELARILSSGENPPSIVNPASAKLAKFLAELENRCDEPWILDSMAAHVGLKRTQFSALFRHHTGDTPILYLNRLRVEKARRLLASTQSPITDIALECGFASSQYFSGVFRSLTGKTASAYRKGLR